MDRLTTRIDGEVVLKAIGKDPCEWVINSGIAFGDFDCRDFPITNAFEKLAHYEDLAEQGRLVELPCKVGDTVYRICPKSNDRHDGSCDNCAWAGCLSIHGCTTYGLWDDGQYPAEKCTIVPYRVFWNYIPDLLKRFGKTVFLTREEAEAKLAKEGGVENG